MVVSEAFRFIRRQSVDVTLTVLTAALLFALGDLFLLSVANLVTVAGDLRRAVSVEVYLRDKISSTAIDSLKSLIRDREGVSNVLDKSPDSAMREMSFVLGTDLSDIVGRNP